MPRLPSAGEAVKAQVFCRVRSGTTLSFDLPQGEAVIGRESAAGVSVPVEGVSRRHARIRWDGSAHWLEHMRSTNGTFLNGELVRREKLRHVDVVTLGRAVDLVFVVRREDFEPVKAQGITAARLVPQSGDATPIEIAQSALSRLCAPRSRSSSTATTGSPRKRIAPSKTSQSVPGPKPTQDAAPAGTKAGGATAQIGSPAVVAGGVNTRVHQRDGEIEGQLASAQLSEARRVVREHHRIVGPRGDGSAAT